MFNNLYADVMAFMDPALLNRSFTGAIDGLRINEVFLVGGAVLMEIPIAMVLLK